MEDLKEKLLAAENERDAYNEQYERCQKLIKLLS